MPAARRTKTPPKLAERQYSYRLAPRRTLDPGDEADVLLPARKRRARLRFMYAVGDTLTFSDPNRQQVRAVKPDAVGTIHRLTKLRATG